MSSRQRHFLREAAKQRGEDMQMNLSASGTTKMAMEKQASATWWEK